MNYLEQVEENKKAIKAEIIEYVALNCIRSSKGVADYYYEVEFRLNNELSISKEVNDRNNYLDFLNKKLEEVFRSNNPLTHKWRVIQYPLLTTLEKEYNLFFEFDSILKIKRGTKKKDNKGGFMNIPSYYNDEIIDYLEGMKTLMNKDNELKELDVIEFLCDHYYIYSGVENYESGEYRPNMKDDIKEFLFTYIDYILYSKYKADYINSKQSNDIVPNSINDKKVNEEEIRKLIIDFIHDDLFLNTTKSLTGYSKHEINVLSDRRNRAIKLNKIEEFSNLLYKKLDEIETTDNPIYKYWKTFQYPLLTTKCKEDKLNVVFDLALSITRKDNDSHIYNSDGEILVYLNGGRELINKGEIIVERDIIELIFNFYKTYANPDIYQEFLDNIEGAKTIIRDFIFLYLEYCIYTRYYQEYLKTQNKEEKDFKQNTLPINNIPKPNPNNLKSIGKLSVEEKEKLLNNLIEEVIFIQRDSVKEFIKQLNDYNLINEEKKGIQISAIACIIYNNKFVRNLVFSKWNKIFLDYCNKPMNQYKPSNLKSEIERLKSGFAVIDEFAMTKSK